MTVRIHTCSPWGSAFLQHHLALTVNVPRAVTLIGFGKSVFVNGSFSQAAVNGGGCHT